MENLQNHYLGIVDERSIYVSSFNPPLLLDSFDNRVPEKLMEESAIYPTPQVAIAPSSLWKIRTSSVQKPS